MSVEYKIPARVLKVEHKSELMRVTKTGERGLDGKETLKHEVRDLGWYMQLEGSMESNFLSMEQPEFMQGDYIELIIRKRKV